MAGCYSLDCNQSLQEAHEKEQKILSEAQARANDTGEWWAIYRDEFGVDRLIRADLAGGYPVTRYVSPKLPHP
jgi:hypothetical protein